MHQPSYWLATVPASEPRPALQERMAVDVAVIGGGIVGITAALLAARAGRRVALLERHSVGSGVTGHTTGKLTTGHGLRYASLEERHGPEVALAYARANDEGITLVDGFVREGGIVCELGQADNVVWGERPSEAAELREEAAACRRAGLAARFEEESELPFPISGSVRLSAQAHLHPGFYLQGLAAAAEAAGATIYEGSPVEEVDGDGPLVLRTPHGTVTAGDVILATHYPTLDRGLMFPRITQRRSYALCARLLDAAVPPAMYVSAHPPTRSLRPTAGGTLLVAAGEGHATGAARDAAMRHGKIEGWLRERFGAIEVLHRWSTQDGFTVDGLPYAGRLEPWRDRRLWVAAGFAGWGLAAGTTSAAAIVGQITGDALVAEPPFSTRRPPTVRAAGSVLGAVATFGTRFVRDRVAPPDGGDVASLARGSGRIVRDGRRQVAVARADDGALHVVSARCTHLGCIVRWNGSEQSWDCPCHGSRFAIDGSVLDGPAVDPLAPARLAPEGASSRA